MRKNYFQAIERKENTVPGSASEGLFSALGVLTLEAMLRKETTGDMLITVELADVDDETEPASDLIAMTLFIQIQ